MFLPSSKRQPSIAICLLTCATLLAPLSCHGPALSKLRAGSIYNASDYTYTVQERFDNAGKLTTVYLESIGNADGTQDVKATVVGIDHDARTLHYENFELSIYQSYLSKFRHAAGTTNMAITETADYGIDPSTTLEEPWRVDASKQQIITSESDDRDIKSEIAVAAASLMTSLNRLKVGKGLELRNQLASMNISTFGSDFNSVSEQVAGGESRVNEMTSNLDYYELFARELGQPLTFEVKDWRTFEKPLIRVEISPSTASQDRGVGINITVSFISAPIALGRVSRQVDFFLYSQPKTSHGDHGGLRLRYKDDIQIRNWRPALAGISMAGFIRMVTGNAIFALNAAQVAQFERIWTDPRRMLGDDLAVLPLSDADSRNALSPSHAVGMIPQVELLIAVLSASPDVQFPQSIGRLQDYVSLLTGKQNELRVTLQSMLAESSSEGVEHADAADKGERAADGAERSSVESSDTRSSTTRGFR